MPQRITFDEANPIMTSVRKGQEIYGQILQNQLAKLRNQSAPESIKQDLLKQQLDNQLSQAKIPFAEAQQRAELEYKEAQAQRERAFAALPFGGQSLTGPAGIALGLDLLKKQYGQNSEQYQRAKEIYDRQRASDFSRINYQNTLINTADKRAATPEGKAFLEQFFARMGRAPTGQEWDELGPGTGVNSKPGVTQGSALPVVSSTAVAPTAAPIVPPANKVPPPGIKVVDRAPVVPPNVPTLPTAPDQKQKIAAALAAQFVPGTADSIAANYELIRMKKSVVPSVIERSAFAKNIEKSLAFIDADNLTQFSGILNQPALGIEFLRDMANHPTENYIKYKEALTTVRVISEQIRQFYSTSIQPKVREELAALANPSAWNVSPTVAKAQFLRLKQILENESETFTQGLETKKAYQKGELKQTLSSAPGKIIGPNGEVKVGSPENIERFLRDHPNWRKG